MENKYIVTDQKFDRIENGITKFFVDVVADSEADIPEPLSYWSAGSVCLIADSKTFKVLNSERQ